MTPSQPGISHQAKLLIMTVLGMTSSALSWKPFELMSRLNHVRDLHLTINNDRFSSTFTSSIKKVLAATVVMEFFCSLASPFAELLKLYSVVTITRSDIMLPWLVIHALNSLIPKILVVGVAVVFYAEKIISTATLFEFLLVETVNFLVAAYNWYVFLDFYLDVRALEHQRISRKARAKMSMLPQVCSSTPNVSDSRSESSISYYKETRLVRSLITFGGMDLQDGESEITWSETASIEENLTPAEKTMRFLKITPEQLENARKRREAMSSGSSLDSYNGDLNFTPNLDQKSSISAEHEESLRTLRDSSYQTPVESNTKKLGPSSIEVGDSCACSSSEDDEEYYSPGPKTFRAESKKSEGVRVDSSQTSIANLKRKVHSDKKTKKSHRYSQMKNLEKSPPDLAIFPTMSRMLTYKRSLHKKNDNLAVLLNKNIQLLDKMCKSLSVKSRVGVKTTSQKWMIFQEKLESTLKGDLFLNDSDSDKDVDKLKKSSLKSKSIDKSKLKSTHNKYAAECNVPESKIIEHNTAINNTSDKSAKENNEKTESDILTEAEGAHYVDFHKFSTVNPYKKKGIQSHPVFSGNVCQNVDLDIKYGKSNFSVLKSSQAGNWANYNENERTRELRNLQAYNNFTLEADRREMIQKKKKSKMTASKKPIPDLIERAAVGPQVNKSTLSTCQAQEKAKLNFSPTCIIKTSTKAKAVSIDMENENPDSSEGSGVTSDNTEIKVIKPASEITASSSISVSLPIGNDTSPRRTSMREAIERLNWSRGTSSSRGIEVPGRKNEFSQRAESRPLADDETLSLLQNAFSFSDETERGFRLGPEASEPYPLYQAVALTVAEIFKASSWRDFERALPVVLRPSEELELSDESSAAATGSTSEPSSQNMDELEQRKSVAAGLLKQLQELLDSSRETISAIENSRLDDVDVSRVRASGENLFFNDTLEYLTTFKDAQTQGEKLKSEIQALNTYVYTVSEIASTSREFLNSRVDRDIQENESTNADNNSDSPTQKDCNAENGESDNDSNSRNDDCENAMEANEEDERRETPRNSRAADQVCSTKFENKMLVHRLRQGQGLTSGQVMQFDSDARSLNLMKSHNSSFTLRKSTHDDDAKMSISKYNASSSGTNDNASVKDTREFFERNISSDPSDDNLVRIFESFYKKIETKIDHKDDSERVQKKLKKLSETDNFAQFMSLFDNRETKVESVHHTEVEISNSDLQNKDIASNFKSNANIGKVEIEETTSKKNKDATHLQETITNRKAALENYRQQLDSDIIKERINNWNKDSEESMPDVLASGHKWTYGEKAITDDSDMEEFTTV